MASTPQQCARSSVAKAVRKGFLPRPDGLPCVDCHGPGKEYDHHQGYAREHYRAVEAVCTKCHGRRKSQRGEQPRGAASPDFGKRFGRRLPVEKRAVIRELHGIGFVGRELAKMYGISQGHVSRIVRGVHGS